MANLTPYAITLGGTDYPAQYAGLLAYIEPYLTNLETFSFSGGNVGLGTTSPGDYRLSVNKGAAGNIAQMTDGVANTFIIRSASSTLLIGEANNNPLAFVTNNTERMRLDASGNLGIGTTTVSARLHVNGNVSYTIPVTFAGATGDAAWTTGFGSQPVNASILATNNIIGSAVYSVSDKRLKSNITPLPGNAGLDFVNAVDPVSFNWKADNSHDTGFIAQSLLSKGYGHLVSAIPDGAMEEVTHEDGNVSPAGSRFVVRYDSIVPILHAAIRDQQALIESLMARVAALEQA